MSWSDDPSLAEDLEAARARSRLVRSAAMWGPIFIIAAGACLFFFVDRLFLGGAHGGTWFFVGFLGFLGFLFGFQALQGLLDLRSGPREVTGVLARSWSRSDALVMRSRYIRLDKGQILRVGAQFHADLKEGERLRVRFYPRSAAAIWVEKLPPDVANGLAADRGG